MITLYVTNEIKVKESQVPTNLLERIKKDLTFVNPEYVKAANHSKSTFGIQQVLSMVEKENGNLVLPRGYQGVLIQHLKDLKIPFTVDDKSITLPLQNFSSKIKLRDYQKEAVEKLMDGFQGGLVSPCGSGKTIMMLELMARIKQPALWIVNTTALLNQVIRYAKEFLGLEGTELGQIGGGKFNIGEKLTVATIQTLARRDLSELVNRFGVIFIDEAHHLPAKTFYNTISKFPAKYRYWCSATPTREDGLTPMLYVGAGPVLHAVDTSVVPTITPHAKVIQTPFDFFDPDFHIVLKAMISDQRRNKLIIKTILAEAKKGNHLLVLSDRIEHLEVLWDALQSIRPDLAIELVKGNTPKKQREDIFSRARERKVDILLATQIAREGLDIKPLNRLFLVTPKKASSTLQQEIGRIMRPSTGKVDAVVYDFWDCNCALVRGQFWQREKAYQKLGMSIEMPKRP